MSSHVHVLAVPQVPESLAFGIGLVNQNYTRYINRKYLRSGWVWQKRFFSCIVDTDEHHWPVFSHLSRLSVTPGNPLDSILIYIVATLSHISSGFIGHHFKADTPRLVPGFAGLHNGSHSHQDNIRVLGSWFLSSASNPDILIQGPYCHV